MPGVTGIELAKVLAKERPTMKVMLVSGSTEEPSPAGCHFLAKPFTTGAMRQAMVHLLPPAEIARSNKFSLVNPRG